MTNTIVRKLRVPSKSFHIISLLIFSLFFTACAESDKKEANASIDYCSGSSSDFQSFVQQYPGSISDERVYMSETLGSKMGVVVGQQVRIYPEDASGKYGIYTVAGWHDDGSSTNHLWMDDSGWARLNQSEPFNGCVNPKAFTYDLSLAQLQSNNEFSCFLSETSTTHTGVVVGSPHGGGIELNTDDQARWFYDRIADVKQKEVSAWYCAGYQAVIGSFDAWHITSTDISRTSFKQLDKIADRGFTYAVSFHGFSRDEFLIGGGASDTVRLQIKTAIEGVVGNAYTVRLASSTEPYAGVSSKNFVNWLTANGANGVQIEQPKSARVTYGKAIAEAVADVFADKI